MLVLSCGAFGTPVPMLDLSGLVDSSDIIAVGEVVETKKLQTTEMNIRGQDMSVNVMQADFRVDHIVKGECARVIQLRFLLPEFGMGYHGVATKSHRIVFLKRTPQALEFTSPFYPSFPAAFFHASQSGPIFDEVVGELQLLWSRRLLPTTTKKSQFGPSAL